MTNFLFFGKPQSFEVYSLSNFGYERNNNSFLEPEIKISNSEVYLIRRIFKENVSYLQLYTFAQSHNSGREGVVIGVGLQSDSIIALNSKNIKILDEELNKFKSIALANFEFKNENLFEILKNYSPNTSFLSKVEFSNIPQNRVSKQSMLLYVEDIENALLLLPEQIDTLKSIYISEDLNTFKSDLNKKAIYAYENKFYTINKQNRIVLYEEEKEIIQPKKQKGKSYFEIPNYPPENKNTNDAELFKNRQDINTLESKFNKFRYKTLRLLQLLTFLIALLLLSTLFLYYRQFVQEQADDRINNTEITNTPISEEPPINQNIQTPQSEPTSQNEVTAPNPPVANNPSVEDTFIVKSGEAFDAFLNRINKGRTKQISRDELLGFLNITDPKKLPAGKKIHIPN